MAGRLRRAAAVGGAACIALVACRPSSERLVPEGARTVSAADVQQWVGATQPAGHVLHRFKWLLRDERSSAGGSGSARLAAPDSLRFDVRGPLGAGAAAAVVIGDSAMWAEPPNVIEKLVPNYPLMWAMFGVARMPEDGARLSGIHQADATMWEYALNGDTVRYLRAQGNKPRLVAEVRQRGKLLGRAETELSPEGVPVHSRLVVPAVPARLDLDFSSSGPTGGFPAKIWSPPESGQ